MRVLVLGGTVWTEGDGYGRLKAACEREIERLMPGAPRSCARA